MKDLYGEAYEKYKSYKVRLQSTLCVDRATEFFNYIEGRGFEVLPASLSHHLNTAGGLLIHSVNVTEALLNLTEGMNLDWGMDRSPYVIGLCHDLCKLEFYKQEEGKFVHNDSPEYNLGGHGMLSLVLAQKFLHLTDEEMNCIRFHMGAYEQKDWSMFDAAIKKYPNVLYTHTADMIASKVLER